MRANALAIFPGGFGTMDEMFELLTLQQTRKAPPAPIVLFGKAYWRSYGAGVGGRGTFIVHTNRWRLPRGPSQ